MSKRTYINLINDFWEADAQKQFSAPVTRVYFYLLNRINRNRWEPVFISDYELSEATGASRYRLPGYRDELKTRGFIDFAKKGTGRQAGTCYGLPEGIDPKGAINRPIRDYCEKDNRPKRDCLEKETDPKGAINRPIRDSLEPSAPINVSLKTSLRPSTTAEDMRASAQAPAREVVEVVEVEAEEVKDKKEIQIAGAAEYLMAEKKKAADQGAEVLKAFFHPYNQRNLEIQLMQNRLDVETYRHLAEEVIADWTEKGETHNDWQGNFDIKAATSHLQNVIRKKADAYRRNQAAPKTRQQLRQDLMAASLRGLQDAINNPYGTQYGEDDQLPDPF